VGIFESIKNAFGNKSESEPTVTVTPSQALRNAGIDPSELKFSFGTGTISVSGEISDASDRQRIIEVLTGLPDISVVQDHMTDAAPASAQPESPAAVIEATVVEGGDGEPADESDTYTVQTGDTLWKIAQQVYEDGSKYMKIFEANTDLLKDPDHIYPGQELKVPRL
jgi:LysM repeat protein